MRSDLSHKGRGEVEHVPEVKKSYPLASQAQARITHSLPPNS
jgi:hypothetical protein